MTRHPSHTHIVLAVALGTLGALGLLWSLAEPRTAGAGDEPHRLAAVVTVCLGGPPTCDYDNIQAAVDAASEGDVIKVASGSYTGVHGRPAPGGYPYPPVSGVVTQVVYISKSITLRGGYLTDFIDPPDPATNPTTIDADGQGRALFITGHTSPTVEGLRITGGDAVNLGGSWVDAGGGAYIISATVTLSNNQVFSNTAGHGGGLILWSCSGTLYANSITSNTTRSEGGGGIALSNSSATLEGNTVSGNSGNFGGGGLYLSFSDATLRDNIIVENNAFYAGGLRIASSDVTFVGNTVSFNVAHDGGGLAVTGGEATLRENIITGNTADSSLGGAGLGGGVLLSTSDATIIGNIVSGNTADGAGGGFLLSYSDNVILSSNTVNANKTNNNGGGFFLSGSDATLMNNSVTDNQANSSGSGLFSNYSAPRLTHNTFARNSGGDGTGIYVGAQSGYYSNVVLTNTILVSHTVGVYVDHGNAAELEATVWGMDTWANGTDWGGDGMIITGTVNIWGDPDFVDPDGGDYHIGPESAALDAGVDAGVTTDIDNQPRPHGDGYDIGADEYWPPVVLRPVFLPIVLRQSP